MLTIELDYVRQYSKHMSYYAPVKLFMTQQKFSWSSLTFKNFVAWLSFGSLKNAARPTPCYFLFVNTTLHFGPTVDKEEVQEWITQPYPVIKASKASF